MLRTDAFMWGPAGVGFVGDRWSNQSKEYFGLSLITGSGKVCPFQCEKRRQGSQVKPHLVKETNNDTIKLSG